jgi:hypothetical protein
MSTITMNETVTIDEADREPVAKIFQTLEDAILSQSKEMKASDRFAGWALMAIANLFCRLSVISGFDRDRAFTLISTLWSRWEDASGKQRN